MRRYVLDESKIRELIRSCLIEEGVFGKIGDVSRFSSRSSSNSNAGGGSDEPDASASIEGEEFVVHGVKFQSVPAVGAGNTAAELYQSAELAGQRLVDGNWETTTTGRNWIITNIYNASKPGSGEKYGKLLGTSRESYWSSWFFSVCYKGFRSEGGHGSSHFDYGADEGLVRRRNILQNPESYVGKVAFVTFAPNEAPVFKGDAVFGFRGGSGTNLSDIASGKPSHMRIFGDNNGTVYGGNESNRVGMGSVKLTTNNTVNPGGKYGKEPYVAVYKRVKVIGRVDVIDIEDTDIT